MIRILHVIGSMNCGGAETLLMSIYRKLDKTKFQFDFVVHTDKKGYFDDEIKSLGGKIYSTKRFNIINYFSYKAFWKSFFKCNPQYPLIHGHINSSAAIYLSCAKKAKRIAVVHSHATKSTEKTLRAKAFLLFSYPIRFVADCFFACSKQAGLDRFGKKIVASNKFSVLSNGIDTNLFHYNEGVRATIREKENAYGKSLVVGHVGRFTAAKNHNFLIQVFEQIYKTNQNAQLWLLGTGKLETEIRRDIKQRGLSSAVKFIGVTTHVADYLQAMDVFVFPSIYEGLAIALIEAQATGLACVVSNNIQKEADINAGIINFLSLKDTVQHWAEEVIGEKKPRSDKTELVRKAGYDINSVTELLLKFYLCKINGK